MKWRTRIARVAGQLAATLRYDRQHAAARYCILPMLASLRWLLPAEGTRRIRSPDSLERAAISLLLSEQSAVKAGNGGIDGRYIPARPFRALAQHLPTRRI